MSEKLPKASEKSEEGPKALLDNSVQNFLGQKLRAAYNEIADKPAYLGDPALPPDFEHQLVRMEATIRTHEEGVEAVRAELEVVDTAREHGLEAVTRALTPPAPPLRK